MGQPENRPDLGSTRAILEEVYDVETTALSSDNVTTPALPRTSTSRLTQSDVAPTPFPTRPIRSRSIHHHAITSDTVLYLAYGSNLCAKTFQGTRGIRPVSRVNVSAPALRLTFDLPGLPYVEPCFANTAPRAVPKPPPGVPDLPDIPDIPDLPPFIANSAESAEVERNERGEPIWTKGLIGVVYEVTREDYAHIVATEGGGASYHDILVPCLPLSAVTPGGGSKPSLPPLPFLAHTLCAPRFPRPGDGDEQEMEEAAAAATDDDDDEEKTPELPSRMPKWLRRFFLPVQRPYEDYAQASPRYLDLLRDGARENDLPAEYRAYLDALQPYRITSLRQRVGLVLFAGSWAPIFMLLYGLSRVIVDDKGRIPGWYGMVMAVQYNSMWSSYDRVFKPIFGDGERTMEDGASKGRSWFRRGSKSEPAVDEERRPLMEQVK